MARATNDLHSIRMATGMALIAFVDSVFMTVIILTTLFVGFFTVQPLATFILLGVIVLGAIAISTVYEKRTFCLYLCPVSGFQGLYSKAVRNSKIDPEKFSYSK